MTEPEQKIPDGPERVMRCREFSFVSKRVYDLPDDMEPSLLALSDIDGDSYEELLIADISGQLVIAKGHALFLPAERCRLPSVNCLLVMDVGEKPARKYIVMICSDGDCVVYNSPAFDYDLRTWVSTTAAKQHLIMNISSAVTKQLVLDGKPSTCLVIGHYQGIRVYRWNRDSTSFIPLAEMTSPHAVHTVDVMPVNSVPFVVVGFIEGQIEVWNLQETEAAKPAGEPSRYSLKLVPGDYVQPQLDSQLVVMQPVCVKATKNDMAGFFVTCNMNGQFMVGRIQTQPHPNWKVESSADTPDMLAFIDHSTISPVEALFQEQFVQAEHAEGPPYIAAASRQESPGNDTPSRARGAPLQLQQPFEVTTMVGWNGWTYFLSAKSDILPVFDANNLLKAPIKSFAAGRFGFEYASVQAGTADDADTDSSISLSMASEIPLMHVSSGVETQSQFSLRFATSDSVNSSVYARSVVTEVVGEAYTGKPSRMKPSTSFRENSKRQLLADDRPGDDTSSTVSRQTHSVMHSESCIVYGYARSVAVVRCLHPHLTEAFASLDESVKLPLHLFVSIHRLSAALRSEAQLEKLPGSIAKLLKWIQQGDRLAILGQYIEECSAMSQSDLPPQIDDAATTAVVAHITNALLATSPHDVLQAKTVLVPSVRKAPKANEAMRRVVSAPAFADLALVDVRDDDDGDDDGDEDDEERDDDEDEDREEDDF